MNTCSTIVGNYGRESILIEDKTITVTIPFTRISNVICEEGNKEGNKILNSTQIKVLAEMRNNPNITKKQLEMKVLVGKTAIDHSVSKLKDLEFIRRVGSNKNGYWQVDIEKGGK